MDGIASEKVREEEHLTLMVADLVQSDWCSVVQTKSQKVELPAMLSRLLRGSVNLGHLFLAAGSEFYRAKQNGDCDWLELVISEMVRESGDEENLLV